jgi:glycosyltransferase involved in cell wall biosynthesis
MNSNLVTVVIPTYNRAALIGETISSVLEQTYENFELLVLDDCSSDNTAEVVRSFKDGRIKYFRHICNIGLVANWTCGVKLASGRYLSILGDDDKYETNFLMRRIEAFKNAENLVAATGAFTCCDAAGRYLRTSKKLSDKNVLLEGMELIRYTLGFTGEWFNGATLYDAKSLRSLWDKVSTAGIALDFSLHMRLTLLPDSKVMFYPDCDMSLRVHQDQESRRNSLYLAECAAKLAVQMWSLEVKGRERETVKLFGQRFVDDINHYGRMLWDRGCLIEARNAFKTELSIDRVRPLTWLRLLRTYLLNPRVIID